MEKTLFVPLKGIYYDKIKDGSQDCEIRPLNHRGWNSKNVHAGRDINFSRGYGKQDRTLKKITKTHIGCSVSLGLIGIPKWHIDAVEGIYGKRDWLVAFV